MCSIFGYIARGNIGPSASVLSKIIRQNIARGPHSFGLAWIDLRGRLHCYKQSGRFTDHLGILGMARNARLLIGHLRYATHGAPEENVNNHPHPADGGWIVHNGVIRNYEALVRSERLWPVSSCDSEVLGLLIERSKAPRLLRRCAGAVEQTQGNLAMLGLWARPDSRPDSLVVARRGNPLHLSRTPGGIYLATLAAGLPGKPAALRDDTVRVFTRADDNIRCRTIRLTDRDDAPANLFDSEGTYEGG